MRKRKRRVSAHCYKQWPWIIWIMGAATPIAALGRHRTHRRPLPKHYSQKMWTRFGIKFANQCSFNCWGTRPKNKYAKVLYGLLTNWKKLSPSPHNQNRKDTRNYVESLVMRRRRWCVHRIPAFGGNFTAHNYWSNGWLLRSCNPAEKGP